MRPIKAMVETIEIDRPHIVSYDRLGMNYSMTWTNSLAAKPIPTGRFVLKPIQSSFVESVEYATME